MRPDQLAEVRRLFPGAQGLDNRVPIYPERHPERRFAEELAYSDGLAARAFGAGPVSPYAFPPYLAAWDEGYADGA
jgi:hypothetical protein